MKKMFVLNSKYHISETYLTIKQSIKNTNVSPLNAKSLLLDITNYLSAISYSACVITEVC